VRVHLPCHAERAQRASLTSPAPLQATYEDKNFVHIIMELCVGGELFDSIVESGSYSERKAAGCFRKMVDMLHHCHELGVMHRDLKPENFLLTSKKDKCVACARTCARAACACSRLVNASW
jgi:serine/threonine protein kinase